MKLVESGYMLQFLNEISSNTIYEIIRIKVY